MGIKKGAVSKAARGPDTTPGWTKKDKMNTI
jgi:hypothetical protein